jgi:hypothetical protein
MTTRDVYDRHTRRELDGDLDAILSDYAPDAIVATPDGIGSGHDYIRQSYERETGDRARVSAGAACRRHDRAL